MGHLKTLIYNVSSQNMNTINVESHAFIHIKNNLPFPAGSTPSFMRSAHILFLIQGNISPKSNIIYNYAENNIYY